MEREYHIECNWPVSMKPCILTGKTHPQVRFHGSVVACCMDYATAEKGINLLREGVSEEAVRDWVQRYDAAKAAMIKVDYERVRLGDEARRRARESQG